MAAKIMLRDQIMQWLEKHRPDGDSVKAMELYNHFPSSKWSALEKALQTLDHKNKISISYRFDGSKSEMSEIHPPYSWRAKALQREKEEDKS